MDTILLIDFNNLAWKGSVAFSNPKEPSYTIAYNFFRNLISLIEQFYPAKIFLCGEGGRSFRHDLYSGYKSNRTVKTAEKHTAETLKSFHDQLNITWDLFEHLPLHRAYAKGFEADDVIYSLALDLKDEDTIIVSNDSDYIQILQRDEMPNISLFNPFSREYVEPPFYHHLTYKICAGDKADNIPSILSPKKAVGVASDPKALAAFLDASEENRANYNLNKELIELKSLPLDKITFMPHHTDYIRIAEVFSKMGFKSFLGEFEAFTEAFKNLN